MKKSSQPTVENLVLLDGYVYAHAQSTKQLDALELGVGKTRVPFMPCLADPFANYSFASSTSMDLTELSRHTQSVPAEATPGDVYACWVNHLPDWSLSGGQTVQMMVTDRHHPCQVQIRKTITVEADGPMRFFEAAIACHRAHASLDVTFIDSADGSETTKNISFDPKFTGGQLLSGYQPVRIALPETAQGCDIRVTLNYDGYKDDGSGVEPFLFVADIKASSKRTPNPSLLSPLHVVGRDLPVPANWYKAPVPVRTAPGDEIKLWQGRTSIPVTKVGPRTIRTRENYGHTLVLHSDIETEAVLYIDGKPTNRIRVATNDTVLRIPSQFLNGAVRHISLKDPTGSITLFETQYLMPAILTPADVIQRETPAPFPTSIFPQTPLRYQALKALLANATPETDLVQASYALSVVEGGYERVSLKPLHFPKVDKPDVSIIIPAYNKIEVTYLCLCSLLLSHNKASFEVIVVDDASTDETAELEKIVSGITVVHNTESQRFIRSCNAGVEQARGKYVVLLNNDTEVTTGWLDELIDAFDRFDNVGLVGSKLLYPTGELQDAGGIIWGSGNPWNYGNKQNAMHPRYCYARQADYLSGAALMLPRTVWNKVGGLSSYLEPMYFEDTDLSFKVRDAGYSTWFVPSSVVYHYEGMTSGTDTTSGFKKFQEVNRPKFKRRWAKAYAGFGKEGQNPDLEKDRGIIGRVLFVDYTTPRGDQDAGSYAALQEIRLVQSLGYKVTFLPMNLAHLGSYTDMLQKMGVEVIYAPFYLSAAEYLEKHAADFDAFFLTRFYVAQDVLGHIRALAPDARLLFNNADLHFLREIRAAASEQNEDRMEAARKTRDEELAVINKVDVVLSYNEVEHSVIQAYTEGRAKVMHCPWVVDMPSRVPGLKGRKGMSFLGSYRHHPNAEGVTWFVRRVMPLMAGTAAELPLAIYGSGMTDDIRALQSDLVDPQGFVQNVSDAFDRHRIFIAPLLSGAGIKGKVLSALGHGIPCVLSPTAAEGIGLRSGHDCFIADTPEEWISAIERLNSDDDLWRTMSDNARTYIGQSFSFETGRKKMRAAFEAADLFGTVT